MPGNDQPKGRRERPEAPASPGQSHVSRRSLLGAAGVGAAGLAAGAFGGLAAAAPAVAATRPATRERGGNEAQRASEAQPVSDEHVVVHVHGGRSGDLDVFSGTSRTRVHDPELAARLRRTVR
jgi:nitrous oxide reductase